MEKLHFIGVGGVGMSGIAKIACMQGFEVTGSDLKASRYTRQLEEAGGKVFIGHGAENVPEGDPVVVISTAILENNPELVEAKRRGCRIIHRADMLARLGRDLDTLAVAGTHGKTTTSSMLATVLDAMGESPTFLIGGTVRQYDTNARSGEGRHYVVEADESDKSFTKLSPAAVIVTSIEADHLDHYDSVDEIYDLFQSFMSSVPEGNPVVVCADSPKLVELARACAGSVRTYGFSADADVRIGDVRTEGLSSRFSLTLPDGRTVESRIAQNPGLHNVSNGAAVIALVDALGLDAQAAAEALATFKGVRRRFDFVGKTRGVTVIDDYAHHPTEIAATIKAAKGLDFEKVHVVFQPHRYSRAALFTDVLRDEFASAFDEADTVTFMDVFSAGETPVPGINGKTFLSVVLDHDGHPPIKYVPRRLEVPSSVACVADEGDLVITMGAGDVTDLGVHILNAVEARLGGDAEGRVHGGADADGGAA